MNKTSLKFFLAVAILFYSVKIFSQTTTTILYDTSSHLSTSKCNVFAPAVNVGGKLHAGVIGGATFSIAKGLTLPTDYTFSSKNTNRTDYRISYPFRSGYSYRIEVTAFGYASNSSAYPSLGAALFTAAGLTYTSTSCGAGDISGFPQLGSLFITQVTNTPTLYSPSGANFTSPYNYDYLVLEATCQAAQNIVDSLYIQKIKIIETPPPPPPMDCNSITIQGPDQICDGSANYSLSSYVGTDNTWSFNSNEGDAFLSSNIGISNILTKVDDGQAMLKVVLSGCTAATATKYKTVTMGPGALTGYCYPRNAISQPLYRETYGWNILGEGGNNQAIVTSPTGAQTWELYNSYTSSGNPVTFSYTQGGYLNINVPYGETYAEFKLTIQTSCGANEYFFEFIAGYDYSYYSLSPNPSTSDITVYVDDEKLKSIKTEKSSDQVIQKIIIIDKLGNAVLQRSYPSDTKKVNLNIGSLRPDFYVVKIFNGRKWVSLKLMKK